MLHYGLKPRSYGGDQRSGNTHPRLANARAWLPALLLAAALSACAPPPVPVVMAPPPPPPPVGHPYQVVVDVPAPTRHIRITAEQQQDVQQAFNVIALKSALMVAALTCNQQDQYDRFMTSFQPHVLAEQHVMDAYFRRSGGYYGQAREDDFVTLLANNQSVNGIAQGAMFCLNNAAEYKAVLALNTDSDLDNFVTDLPPDATAVAAAGPVITPLAPQQTNLHVAVVPSSHHLRLLQSHRLRHGLAPGLASDAIRPAAVPDATSAKPLSVAAVEP